MRVSPLHPFFEDRPERFAEVDLTRWHSSARFYAPSSATLALPLPGSMVMYQYTPFTGYWYMILISSGVRVRSVGPNGNACEPHQVCRVLNLLASLSRPAVYLVYNLTRMNRRSRRTALYDGVGQGSQVLVGVFGQLLIAKFRFQLSRINRAAHITGRVGHLVATYHFSARAPKASAL